MANPAVLSGTIVDGGAQFAVSIQTTDGTPIDPSRPTWLIIHGWNSSPAVFADLVSAIHNQRPTDQILVLDWHTAANTGAFDPFDAEKRIPLVATWAATALKTAGFSGANLNEIGHSFGAYVAGEIAEQIPGGVNTIVALDPAIDVSGNYNPEGAGGVQFAQYSQYSWAFHDSDPANFGISDGFGSPNTPVTADEAFDVANSNHSQIRDLFTYFLNHPTDPVGQYFTLQRLLDHQAGAWSPNQYNASGTPSAGGGYEAVITATSSGVVPQSIAYTNPASSISLSVNDVTITEGNSGTTLMTFTVTRTGGPAAFDVNFATSNGTATVADSDYVAASGTLHFANSVNTQTISVTVNGDISVETDETLSVALSGATNGAVIADNTGIGTIANDDASSISVAINDVTITEGNSGTTLMTFTVTRTGGPAAFDINFATSNGSATVADGDYAAASGTLHFATNVNTQTISIPVNGDTKAESDETLSITLSGATNGAVIADNTGIGTIANDDASSISVAINDVTITEGNSGTTLMTFTVTRTGGPAAFDVDFATSNGSATVADGDYVAASGTLHFATNVNTQTISIPVNGDIRAESNETLSVTLSGATNGAAISDNLAIGTITNDDANHAPVVTVPSASVLASTGQSLQASSLFTATDADNDALTYRIYDGTWSSNSGHFVVNGTVVPAGWIYTVTAAQWAQTTFVAGTVADEVYAQANDGKVLSNTGHVTVNVTAAPVLLAAQSSLEDSTNSSAFVFNSGPEQFTGSPAAFVKIDGANFPNPFAELSAIVHDAVDHAGVNVADFWQIARVMSHDTDHLIF